MAVGHNVEMPFLDHLEELRMRILWVLGAVIIGVGVAFWLIFAGVAEFLHVPISAGWKWVHIVLGVLFVVGGIMALTAPFQTFTVLAGLIGFFLVLKGTFDFVMAIAAREALDLWWLTLIAGIFEVILGIWAMGYPGRSAALLILWIGIGAIVRGVAEIVLAFQVRKAPEVMGV